MTTLVTGAAGFIGFHVVRRLLARGDRVLGFDNLNAYYDPALKRARLALLRQDAAASGGTLAFVEADIADQATVDKSFERHGVTRVIHLAAQAGVRHSLTAPRDYVTANLLGFANILEASRSAKVAHLTYASTSSVYGGNARLPFRESDGVDHPLQFYAVTKRANELAAHAYSHLFGLPTTGLRFFTVYGPWGRPDMALFLFTKNILAGEPITLFNGGAHSRAFTYIDDIVEGVLRISDAPATPDPAFDPSNPDPATSFAPFRLYNIGGSERSTLADYVAAIEAATGRKAIIRFAALQPGDVPDTQADGSRLEAAAGFVPRTPLAAGVQAFVEWYRAYYGN